MTEGRIFSLSLVLPPVPPSHYIESPILYHTSLNTKPMMNFTFNFFFPLMTAFTTLWAAMLCNRRTRSSEANVAGCTSTTPTLPQPTDQPRRNRGLARRAGLRRSARLQHKYLVPEKPILSTTHSRRRKLSRQDAIADLEYLEPGNFNPGPILSRSKTNRQLKREDSFILVDYGNHFRMVKPAYAKWYCHSVPENIRTVAPLHAFGPNVGEQELRERLLAVPIPPIGTKRKKEKEAVVDARPRKRRRSV